MIQEDVLRAPGRGALVAVDHREVRVAGVERVVVRHAGRVVGRRQEEAAPGHPARGRDVVVADDGPEREPRQDVAVWHEEFRVEPEVVHDVAGVQEEVGVRGEHEVADRVLIRIAAPGVAHDEERERRERVVGPEDRFRSDRHTVSERCVGVRRALVEAVHRDDAHAARRPADFRDAAVGRAQRDPTARRAVRLPEHRHGMRGQELQVRAAGDVEGGCVPRRHEQRQPEQPCRRRPHQTHHRARFLPRHLPRRGAWRSPCRRRVRRIGGAIPQARKQDVCHRASRLRHTGASRARVPPTPPARPCVRATTAARAAPDEAHARRLRG